MPAQLDPRHWPLCVWYRVCTPVRRLRRSKPSSRRRASDQSSSNESPGVNLKYPILMRGTPAAAAASNSVTASAASGSMRSVEDEIIEQSTPSSRQARTAPGNSSVTLSILMA